MEGHLHAITHLARCKGGRVPEEAQESNILVCGSILPGCKNYMVICCEIDDHVISRCALGRLIQIQ